MNALKFHLLKNIIEVNSQSFKLTNACYFDLSMYIDTFEKNLKNSNVKHESVLYKLEDNSSTLS